MLSGEVNFVRGMLIRLASSDLSREDAGRVIIHVYTRRQQVSRRAFHAGLVEAEKMLEEFGFRHARWMDWLIGGPTNGLFVFGFGPTLHRHPLPRPVPGLRRYVGQYVNPKLGPFGAVKIPRASIPMNAHTGEQPGRHLGALTMGNVLRIEDPFVDAWCPTVYDKLSLIRRPLEVEEMLRIFQFPLDMDVKFNHVKGITKLPFLESPSGELVGVLLRQLWGGSVGGGWRN